MKTIKGHNGTTPSTDYIIYDGPVGRVGAVGNEPRPGELERARSLRMEGYMKPYVFASALNTKDLDEAEKFANAILAAVKQARKLNKKLGLAG